MVIQMATMVIWPNLAVGAFDPWLSNGLSYQELASDLPYPGVGAAYAWFNLVEPILRKTLLLFSYKIFLNFCFLILSGIDISAVNSFFSGKFLFFQSVVNLFVNFRPKIEEFSTFPLNFWQTKRIDRRYSY